MDLELDWKKEISYDIIGDIHGYSDHLERLLQKLGYFKIKGVYEHPAKRKVVFLGDYIDRGPKIRETLHIVKDMCDAGNAFAIMGNHEFNAICFHTKHTENGGFFRDHNVTEIEQHLDTLRQFKFYEKEWNEFFLPWMNKLPLFIEFDKFRVVHACWDSELVEHITQNKLASFNEFVNPIQRKNLNEFFKNKDTNNLAFRCFEELLKGKEFLLEEQDCFFDSDGNLRNHARIKWFQSLDERNNYGDVFLGLDINSNRKVLTNTMKHNLYSYPIGDKKVFFGHYWLTGKPNSINKENNMICLDYSVAKGGHLVAYRFDTDEIFYI